MPTDDTPTDDSTAPMGYEAQSGARYDLDRVIASGGMGDVLSAFDRQIGREVAIKRMKRRAPSDRALARFFREATIQGRLDHPAIVPVHELGVDPEGRPFFVMKRLSGTTLADQIRAGHPREALLRAFIDVCLAVEFAHSRGIIHRDLKPSNIVLGDYGEVYVLDWGVAKVFDVEDDHDLTLNADVEGQTEDGAVIGTFGYMAPEQAGAAAEVDRRADVYALGCILFEILAREPLHGRGATSADARPSSRGKDAPPELELVCVAATQMRRDARIATARDLGERVQRFLDGDRDLAQRRELAASHLDAARQAFAAEEDEATRRTAMREAGRALALDPSPAAAELVGRLMLEPPRKTPPEVAREIAREDEASLRHIARIGAWAYAAFLPIVPTVLLNATDVFYPVTLGLLILLNIGVLLYWPYRRSRSGMVVLCTCLVVATVARIFSPFFVAPSAAAIATVALVFRPNFKSTRDVALLAIVMTLAVLLPFLAEKIGVFAPTMTITEDSIAFHSPSHPLGGVGTLVGLFGYTLILVAVAAFIGHAMRRGERAMRARLHLQSWQLRQLVPDAAP